MPYPFLRIFHRNLAGYRLRAGCCFVPQWPLGPAPDISSSHHKRYKTKIETSRGRARPTAKAPPPGTQSPPRISAGSGRSNCSCSEARGQICMHGHGQLQGRGVYVPAPLGPYTLYLLHVGMLNCKAWKQQTEKAAIKPALKPALDQARGRSRSHADVAAPAPEEKSQLKGRGTKERPRRRRSGTARAHAEN